MKATTVYDPRQSTALTKTMEDFALAADFGSVLVDIHGQETSDLYNFSPFCQLMRSNPQLKHLCQKCDAFGGLEASKNGTPHIYRCHAGLTDISLPIIQNNRLTGFAQFGQVELIDEYDERDFYRIHPIITDWRKDPEMIAAHEKVRKVTMKQVKAAASLLQTINDYHFADDDPRDRITFTYKKDKPQEKAAPTTTSKNNEVRKALNYIHRNLNTALTLEEVADHVYLSQFYFSRLFKKEVGQSFVSYLNRQRIDQAKSLLMETNLSIKTIAKNIGYAQTSYFCKIFKELEGSTPANFRKSKA